ncbi:MAG TPA: hypothetical protein VFG64_06715 [Dongiaceae bacterium]|nr:hypothetical protein [Dongiaceae bacterium]
MIIGPLSPDSEALSHLLHDADGNLRGALICWAIAVSALIVFRASRQVVLACLVVAAATVGLAALVIDAAPVNALASSSKSQPQPMIHRVPPPRAAVFERR